MINVTQTELNKELGRMYQIAGQTASDLNFLSNYLITEIFTKQEFKYLQWVEVQLAFKNGVAGDYGKFMGINVNTLAGFIRAYRCSDEKKDFDKKNAPILVSLPEISQGKKDEIFMANIIPMLESENKYDASLPVCYDFLLAKGIIRAEAIKYKDEAKNVVLANYFKELDNAKNQNDKTLVIHWQTKIDNLKGSTKLNLIDDIRFHAKILFMKALDLQDLKNKIN